MRKNKSNLISRVKIFVELKNSWLKSTTRSTADLSCRAEALESRYNVWRVFGEVCSQRRAYSDALFQPFIARTLKFHSGMQNNFSWVNDHYQLDQNRGRSSFLQQRGKQPLIGVRQGLCLRRRVHALLEGHWNCRFTKNIHPRSS